MSNEDQEVNLDNLHEEVTAALNGEEVQEGQQEAEAPEYSEAELQAIEKGWNPEGVEGKRNLTAEEFLDRESFFDEIHKLKREVRSQKQMVEALKQHNSTVSEKAYEKAVKDLKAQKLQAADNEDLSAVIAIDEQIEELRQAKEASKAQETPTTYTKEDWEDAFDGFISKNPWYNTDRKRQVFADAIGVDYVQKNRNASPEEVYEYVLKEVNKEFKDAAAPARPTAPAVAGAGRRAGKQPKKYTLADVPEEDREVAKIVIASGISEEDYLKQYFQQ